MTARNRFYALAAGLLLAAPLSGCNAGTQLSEGQEFGGTIARSYEDSEEWWPEPVRPPEDAPNVLILLLDDVGFAQVIDQEGTRLISRCHSNEAGRLPRHHARGCGRVPGRPTAQVVFS